MTKVKLHAPVAEMHGEFEKKLRPGASKLYRKQYSKLDTFIQALLRQKTAKNN